MNIDLCDFQEDALRDLIAKTIQAQDAIQSHGDQQIISFSAPTGSGKTIMMMALFESIFDGNQFYPEFEPAPETVIIWLSDSPELNEQTNDKFFMKTSVSLLHGATILDANFDEPSLQAGIYFLNTQKLSKGNHLTKSHTDERQYSIWETIENTVKADRAHVLLVIDEAHKGTKTPKEAKEAASTMQKFLMGSPDDGLSPMPLIIGMSATPQRFNKLIECVPSTTIHKVTVSPERVRESGLLKDHIYIRYPQSSMTPEMTLLEAAADNWKEKCEHWAAYMKQIGEKQMQPVFVIQVEDGTGKNPSATDLDTALSVIEQRIGRKFEPHEVVHTFDKFSKLTLHGLEVDYLEPSAIDSDENAKVVFFKMNLSTGWDCPRAETMMSFRRAKDGTYIAQLLGRMVRTPLARRITEDETLNDVALYLPKFDKKTVEEVVKALQEEELPTDIDTSNTEMQDLSIPGLDDEDEDEENDGPDTPETPSTDDESDESQDGNLPAPEHPTETPHPLEETDLPFPDDDSIDGGSHPTHPTPAPQPAPAKPKPAPTPKPAAPTLNRAKMFHILNNAGLATYVISKQPHHTDFQSLLALANHLTLTGKIKDASQDVHDAFTKLIHDTIEHLKKKNLYDKLAHEITDFNIESKVIDAFGMDVETANEMARQLVTSEIDIEHQFEKAERQLGLEGIGMDYLKTYGDPENLNSARLEVVVFMNDPQNLVTLRARSTEMFNQLKDESRLLMLKATPKEKSTYNNIIKASARISKHNFELPRHVQFPSFKDGKIYRKHLICNPQTLETTIKLNPWEDDVLMEEAKDKRFCCWLRNLDRQPWSLAIPYKKDDTDHLTYPDLIIIRKNADIDTGYVVDLLEPHDPTRTDNLPKAKGFAEYAKNDGQYLGRIQLIRKQGKDYIRLDLTKSAVQEGIETAKTDSDLTQIFDMFGITGTN